MQIKLFFYQKENLWKKMISVKYGQESLDWRTNEANGRLEGDFEGNKLVLGKYRVQSW